VIYAYHFILLHQLRHLFHQNPEENLRIPYFLLQSLREMSEKVQKGKKDALAHHGLINIIVCEALGKYECQSVMGIFMDMDKVGLLRVTIVHSGINP
jgi:hypothetical protein